jgi:hypothetical protein
VVVSEGDPRVCLPPKAAIGLTSAFDPKKTFAFLDVPSPRCGDLPLLSAFDLSWCRRPAEGWPMESFN